MEIICIDADDFHEGNHKLDLLERLHDNTGMVFNLFTIPGLCSQHFIREVKKIPWIDMIPHGLHHPNSRECQFWTYPLCVEYIDNLESLRITHGFKAPGWQISDGMYKALKERHYWVADQHYNDHRRPEGLKVFYCNPDHHFHIGHTGGHNPNEIELHIDRLLSMRGEFKFIKDII